MKKKTVVVIGMTMLGVQLVEKLKELKAEVIAIDKDKNKASLVEEYADRIFILDATDSKALEELSLDLADEAIVAIGQGNPSNVVSCISITLALKKLGIKEIIVRLDDDNYKDLLTEIGATYLFTPLQMASERLANIVVADHYEDYFNIDEEYSVLQIIVGKNHKEITLKEFDAPNKYGVLINLIKRDDKVIMPTGETILKPDDVVFAFGENDKVRKLAEKLSK